MLAQHLRPGCLPVVDYAYSNATAGAMKALRGVEYVHKKDREKPAGLFALHWIRTPALDPSEGVRLHSHRLAGVAGDALASFAVELTPSADRVGPFRARHVGARLPSLDPRPHQLWARWLRRCPALDRTWDLLVQIRTALIGLLPYWFSPALRRRSFARFRDAARALNILAEPAALGLCARQRMQGTFAELTQRRAQRDTSKTRPHPPSS